MKKALNLHPFLFALYPILFLYAKNIGEVRAGEAMVPSAVIVGAAALAWLLIRLLSGRPDKSALFVSLLVFLFFSFGHIHNVASGKRAALAAYVLWPAIFLAGTFFIVRTKRNLQPVTRVLNIVAAALVLASAASVLAYELRREKSHAHEPAATESAEAHPDAELPDIYHIILDAYAREDVLREVYGYDNSEFVGYLREKGFFVADESISNYNKTFLTLASTLNLEYLDGYVAAIGAGSDDRKPMWNRARDNKVFAFLRKMGYKVALFDSVDMRDMVGTEDYHYKGGRGSSLFRNELINTTPLVLLTGKVRPNSALDFLKTYRGSVLYTLKNLWRASAVKPPVFVLAHVPIPHPAFVFGPGGEEVVVDKKITDQDADALISEGRLTLDQYLQGYNGQVEFVNKMIREAVDKILSSSDRPVVIVLQGDHGPRALMSWEDPGGSFLKESMTCLYAIYVQGKNHDGLYDGISHVNTYRLIFNKYFGADFAMLTDKSYFSTASRPYDFVDVTDRVKDPDYSVMHRRFGEAALRDGRDWDAMRHFLTAVELDPSDAMLHNMAGEASAKVGWYGEAKKHFLEALKIMPGLKEAQENLDELPREGATKTGTKEGR